MTVETRQTSMEFEQSVPIETERKFLPIFPEGLSDLRHDSMPIEQYYLSRPDEQFSLRMREYVAGGELRYEATLKDKGVVTDSGLRRLEITAPVSKELYDYYLDMDSTPIIRKLRAEPLPGIAVDFYDDGSIQVESESLLNWDKFINQHGDVFMDITGDRIGSNEWRAHMNFRQLHDGGEAIQSPPDLNGETVVQDILLAFKVEARPLVVHIGGRSGSGKSTLVNEVRSRLAEYGLTTEVLSTDNYHRGSSWLQANNNGQPWEHWDDPIVYDTRSMANDIEELKSGRSIARREIDWIIAEPVAAGEISPADILLIEGIYAHSPDIMNKDHLSYEVQTPLATCIGRRLMRDLRERPEFADPVKSLGYMLSEAEPAYRRQRRED